MGSRQKTIIMTVAVILIIAVGVVFWYWQKKDGAPGTGEQAQVPSAAELSPAEVKVSLGAQILEQTQNPLKGKLPPTNPFEEAETNPLKDVYQNPF